MEITLAGFSFVAIIGVLVALAKQLGIASRWLPLLSVIIGIIIGIITSFYGSVDLLAAILAGFFAGAATSGIYDIGKGTILNK